MLLANYASDSDDSGSDAEVSAPVSAARPSGSSNNKHPPSVPKPPVTTSSPASGSAAPSAALGAKGKKRTGPIKITLDLPKASKGTGKGKNGESDAESGEEGEDGERGTAGDGSRSDDEGKERGGKRVKLGGGGLKGGAGSSSLLGMLPAPKRKLPTSSAPARSLGSGVGGEDKKSSLSINRSSAATSTAVIAVPNLADDEGDEEEMSGPSMLLPPSMAKKAARAKVEKAKEEELDLFGLGTSSTPAPIPARTSLLPPSTSISSAPAISDFQPPEPTPSDPYPGYYQLPSGQWAAYEPEYYHSFFPSTNQGQEAESGDRGDGRRGHGWNDFRAREGDMVDVYASEGLAEARAEEERRQMRVKPKMTGDDFVYQPIGAVKGAAADKHQLSSLLSSAYSQREALEQRIADNKKSSRVARTKYGF